MAKIYVIGGANIDIIANSINDIIPEDSNIANISFNFGGVARNIAENLSNLGENIYFVSAFSNDSYGNSLANDCIEKGFNLSFSKFVDDVPSSIYLAIMNANKDMYVACNDMRIADCIDKDLIDNLIDVVNDEDYVVIDTNLNEDTILYIFDNLKGKKIMDAISVNKVYKLQKVIHRIDILKLNKMEAEAIFEGELKNDDGIITLMSQLNFSGTKEVIISTKNGMYVGKDNDVFYYEHDQFNKNVKNVTGAGDSMLAAYVYGDFHNLSVESKCCLALANATLNVQSENAVRKVDIHDVSKQLTNIKIKGGKLKTSI